MRILFVMDPAETMVFDKDTSFAFLRAAEAAGHSCYHALITDLGARGGEGRVTARPISVRTQPPYSMLGASQGEALNDFDAILIRKDPPFDTAYLHATQILDLVAAETVIMNRPSGLRAANEKLFALHFSRFMPETVVTRRPEEILDFVERRGEAVLKPLDGAGGSGVVRLTRGDKNCRALVELLTREGKDPAMVQAFEPSIVDGDKRVLLLDGEVLGAIRRVPRPDEFRANIHVGGRVVATSLEPEEVELVAILGKELSRLGLYFVGLDLIAGKLIEVNVTSPTGIQELGRLSQSQPEQRVIAWIEEEHQRRRGPKS